MTKRKYSTFMIDEILEIRENSPKTLAEQVNWTKPASLNSLTIVDVSNVGTISKDRSCIYCGKAFDRPSLMLRHLRTHTGLKPFECAICGRAFSTSSSVNTHVRIHNGIRPCKCEVCGKTFTAGSNLYYHQLTHKENKPHKCGNCGKTFSTPSELKCHQYSHSGQHPYKCSCGKKYGNANLYRNHLMRHLGMKPEKCPLCVKNFTIEAKLRDHVKYFHGLDNYECKIKDEDMTVDALERAFKRRID
ncbi:hypothetical protein ACOME3_004614 [Neoechinorhynchus agilis]